MEPVTLILLLALPLLLIASGVFSGSETALFSLGPHERAHLAKQPSAPAAAVAMLLQETTPLLVTLLISNMVINVLYFTLSTVLLERWSSDGTIGPVGAAGLALATLMGIILFGEVLPKQVAAQRASAWSLVVAVPLFALHRALAPLRLILTFTIITPLSRLIAPPAAAVDLSAEELGAMLRYSQRRGAIDQSEQNLLAHVIELSRLRVRDLMVPRVDIRAYNLDDPPADLTTLARKTRLRYLPVYQNSLDGVRGLIRSRDVLLDPPETAEQITARLVPVRYVPEIAPADVLLARLRDEAGVLAIVVDEYGGTAGLITLEDVVEHMVGEIPGAFEAGGEPVVEALGNGVFRVDADLPVHDWAQWFGPHPSLARAAAGATTVGGLFLARLGHLPEEGDRARLGHILMTVDAMDGRRIDKLTITVTGDRGEANVERGGDA